MFSPANSAQVYIATGVTDMRKSINGLSILVADQLELNPLTGHLFAFCNRKRDIVKILYWDRNGFWHKRLEQDRFQWPKTEEDALNIRGHELSWLLDGLSLSQCEAHRRLSYEIMM
ncbi:MAG: IS66 family insertion sequence element accessory protein TnpB [Thermodesulfobacteriota bacterium]|nr:IS66 family insertion sequence element accessory protein TnpB [Thermodesulfobacteriota bacterium]